MTPETAQTILDVSNACGKDETRAALMGVNIRIHKKDLIVEACDGRILIKRITQDEKLFDLVQRITSFQIMNTKPNKDILKLLAKRIKALPLSIEPIKGQSASILYVGSFRLEIETLRFPNIEQMIHTKKGNKFSMDANLIIRLAKSLKNNSLKQKIITFEITDKNNPIKIHTNEKTVIIIMPIRSK